MKYEIWINKKKKKRNEINYNKVKINIKKIINK